MKEFKPTSGHTEIFNYTPIVTGTVNAKHYDWMIMDGDTILGYKEYGKEAVIEFPERCIEKLLQTIRDANN